MSRNPDITPEAIAGRIAGSFPGDMGIEPLEFTDEQATGRMIVDERHLHPGGVVHGGVWVALADSVAAWQTFLHLPSGHDFTTIEMKLGQIQVLVPPNVDVTADVSMSEGRAVVFGTEYDARQAGAQPFTDPGTDGPGGGSLHLNIVMNTGNVEVAR